MNILGTALSPLFRMGGEVKRTSIPGEVRHRAVTGHEHHLRPIGHTWTEILPGNPLDPRAASYQATYEIIAHIPVDDGGHLREEVRRVKFEKIPKH